MKKQLKTSFSKKISLSHDEINPYIVYNSSNNGFKLYREGSINNVSSNPHFQSNSLVLIDSSIDIAYNDGQGGIFWLC